MFRRVVAKAGTGSPSSFANTGERGLRVLAAESSNCTSCGAGSCPVTASLRLLDSDLKAKLAEEGFEPYDKIVQLKLLAEDGKLRETDCANTKNMFRIIQSIPPQKAEPFKQWFAQVGYERVEEIQNPELAQKRMKELYRAKGYSEDWIEKRVRRIIIQQKNTK